MFKGFQKVFSFTFRNQLKGKGYRGATITIALILLLAPLLILPLSELYKKNHSDNIDPCNAQKIYVVNEVRPEADFNKLNDLGIENYTDLQYVSATGVEETLDRINEAEEPALVLLVTATDSAPRLQLIVPSKSGLGRSDASHLEEFLQKQSQVLTGLLVSEEQSGEEMLQMIARTDDSYYTVSDYRSGGVDQAAKAQSTRDSIIEGLSFALPYVSIMLMYFLVILYCSGVSMSVVLEKESKLMDMMLVSVRPEAMVLGKLLAIVASAFIQIATWLVSVVVGLIGGSLLALIINPAPLVNLFSLAGSSATAQSSAELAGAVESASTGMTIFSPGGFVIAVLFFLGGFLLYCSLAAIFGSFASTKEEVGSTNSGFTMILLASFFLSMFGGGMSAGSTPVWMYIFPFTAVLVAPAGAILGTAPLWAILLGLILTYGLALVLTGLSGRVYRMMSLYKGNVPKWGQIFKVILGRDLTQS